MNTKEIREMKKNMNRKVTILFISSLFIGILGTRLMDLLLLSQHRIFNGLRAGIFIIVAIFMLCCALLVAWFLDKKLLGKLFITLSIFVLSTLIFIISVFFMWSNAMNF